MTFHLCQDDVEFAKNKHWFSAYELNHIFLNLIATSNNVFELMPIYAWFYHPYHIICIYSKHLYTSLFIIRPVENTMSLGEHLSEFFINGIRPFQGNTKSLLKFNCFKTYLQLYSVKSYSEIIYVHIYNMLNQNKAFLTYFIKYFFSYKILISPQKFNENILGK